MHKMARNRGALDSGLAPGDSNRDNAVRYVTILVILTSAAKTP